MQPHPASPSAREQVVLGVVGGSGLYGMDELENVKQVRLDTPFGQPSAAFTVGELSRSGRAPLKAVFLPRHGQGHVLNPSEINYRANVHGFKQLGVTHVLSVSAVGSLREAIAPGHLVLPDQMIDRTKQRDTTYFGGGCVAHVQFGEPTTPEFRALALKAAKEASEHVHDKGTLIVMEGPAFSTRAESEMYRSWGADVIGMTALPEAKLVREAEMGYALLACSTDYDCWHQSEEEVSVEAVIAVLQANVARARAIVRRLAELMPETTAELPYPAALENALITAPDKIPAVTRERLDLICGHYLPKN